MVQCDNVLLRSFFCINLALKWRTLHQLYAQVGWHHQRPKHQHQHHYRHISQHRQYHKHQHQQRHLSQHHQYHLHQRQHHHRHFSVMIEIPGYLFCIFVMDCWGRRPILSFCQVINGDADADDVNYCDEDDDDANADVGVADWAKMPLVWLIIIIFLIQLWYDL